MKNNWQTQFEYRLNILLWRLRSITILLVFYFLWASLTSHNSIFAGYSRDQIFTYFFLINMLRPIILDGKRSRMAQEINDGSFSRYLVMPVNHFWYEFSQQLSEKPLHLFFAIIEVSVFVLVLNPSVILPSSVETWLLFSIAVILAVILRFILNYLINLIAFWSREAMGPIFLYDWILEFSSGVYFPLSLLMKSFLVFLGFLPFFYLIYFPITIFLSKTDLVSTWQGISVQIIFIIVMGCITKLAFQKSLKKFTGEGI